MLTLHESKKTKKSEFHQKVKNLILSEKIESSDVKDLMAQKRNAIDDILPEVLPEVLEFHASLSSEQKKEVVEIMEKFKHKGHGRFKH